jgi:nitrogen fixation protein NifU and related proteins
MYSPTVLDHLENPRNVGEMENASARGEAINPVCSDLLHLSLKVDDGRITAASFQVKGCPPSIAAGSVLTEMISGLTLDEARALTPRDFTLALETLPRHKEHCSVLAIDALRSALNQLSVASSQLPVDNPSAH